MPAAAPRIQPVLRRAQRGDAQAWETLLGLYGPRVYGLCARLAPDPEDCYQQIWEKVFRALPRFDPRGPADLGSWIGTIARRALIDRHRRRSRAGQVLPLEEYRDPGRGADEQVERRQRSQALERALRRLPPDQRHVVLAHHLQGVPLATLAAEEGVALGTIKSRLHRGRARLAQLMGGMK